MTVCVLCVLVLVLCLAPHQPSSALPLWLQTNTLHITSLRLVACLPLITVTKLGHWDGLSARQRLCLPRCDVTRIPARSGAARNRYSLLIAWLGPLGIS